jgi:hypothetical protein
MTERISALYSMECFLRGFFGLLLDISRCRRPRLVLVLRAAPDASPETACRANRSSRWWTPSPRSRRFVPNVTTASFHKIERMLDDSREAELPRPETPYTRSPEGRGVVIGRGEEVPRGRELGPKAPLADAAPGSFEPGTAPGRERLVQGQDEERLLRLVRAYPDATLNVLRELLLDETGVSVSETAMWRQLERMGITLKKKQSARPNKTDRM